MAYSPVGFINPQYYVDYANWWLKGYQQATTTPLSMATDSSGLTQIIRAEITSAGFIKTSGGALFTPHFNQAYDIWIFPTAAEADANDTTNAIQVADNLSFGGSVDSALGGVSRLFDTVSDMSTSTDASISAGDQARTKGFYVAGDDGSGIYDAISGVGSANGRDRIANATLDITFVLRESDTINAASFGLSTSLTDAQNGAILQGIADSLVNKGGTVYIPVGTYNVTSLSMPDATYDGIHFIGVSAQRTTLNFTSTGTSISMVRVQNATFENMVIDSPNSNIMVFMDLCTQVTFRKIRHTNVGNNGADAAGYRLEQTLLTHFEEFNYGGSTNANTGIDVKDDSDVTTFLHCNIKGGGTCFNTISLTGGTSHPAHVATGFRECVIGGGTNASLAIATDADARCISIDTCYFETGINALILGNSAGDFVARQVTMRNLYFFGFANDSINFNRTDNCSAKRCDFSAAANGGNNIIVNSDVTKNSNLVFEQNQLVIDPTVPAAQKSIRYQRINGDIVDRLSFLPDDAFGTAWAPGIIATGTSVSITLAAAGAKLGGSAIAALNVDPQGLGISAAVKTADQIEVTLINNTGGNVVLAGGSTVRAAYIPFL